MKSIRRALGAALLLGAVAAGLYIGLTMEEEKSNRVRKLAREGIEMPFRLFV